MADPENPLKGGTPRAHTEILLNTFECTHLHKKYAIFINFNPPPDKTEKMVFSNVETQDDLWLFLHDKIILILSGPDTVTLKRRVPTDVPNFPLKRGGCQPSAPFRHKHLGIAFSMEGGKWNSHLDSIVKSVNCKKVWYKLNGDTLSKLYTVYWLYSIHPSAFWIWFWVSDKLLKTWKLQFDAARIVAELPIFVKKNQNICALKLHWEPL